MTVDSEYDERNRLKIRNWFDADVPIGETPDVDPARVDFLYTAAGREAEIRRYSDFAASTLVGRTVRTYDLAGRSDLLIHSDAVDQLLAGYDYDYDFSGLVTHEERTHQDSQYAQSIDYIYDLTGQLTDALFSGQDDEHYEYDANGNRLISRVGTKEHTYTTGLANQLTSDSQFHYDYDGEGNQIKRLNLTTGETSTFKYDHRNRLVEAMDWSSDPGGDLQNPVAGAVVTQSVDYVYDALGSRIARSVDADGAGSQASRLGTFVFNGDNVWADFNETGERLAIYLFGDEVDLRFARFDGAGQVLWSLNDSLLNVRDVVGGAGQLLNRTEFSTFGEILSHADSSFADRFAFTSREFDEEIGAYFYRARLLSITSGRFFSVDPISFTAQDANLYRYVFNRPAVYSDPFGLMAIVGYGITSKPSQTSTPAIRCAGQSAASAFAREAIFLLVNELISRGFQSQTGVPLPPDFDIRDLKKLQEALQGFEFGGGCGRPVTFNRLNIPGGKGFRPNPNYPRGGFNPIRPGSFPGLGGRGPRT